jgi:predicted DNA-binding transcriptional regulator YafY
LRVAVDRTERFYKIDQLLKGGTPVPFARLAYVLGVSPASLKRDIAYMRDRFNAPIEYDRAANGYLFGQPRSGPRYELPGLWFSGEEIYALLTTLHLLGNLQRKLLEGQVPALVARLRGILGAGDHTWQEVEKRIRIFQPERREGDAAWFTLIAAALLKRSRLFIRHYNRNEDRITEREVSPQRLIHYRDNWYLDAWCHLRNDLRSFSVDAIQDAELRETKAKDVPKADLDAYLGSGYGIFAGRKVEWASLKFTPKAARWVSAQRWHPDERHRVESDGSYILEVPYADDRELLMEIQKFGPDVEVLAPPALRRRVAESLKAAARRYD